LHDRKRDRDSLRLGVDGAYAEDEDETTTENVKGVAEYRENISDRAYILGGPSILYDSIADIDYRVIVSVGPGYYLMKDAAASLVVDVGPAFITEKVGGEACDWAVRLGERYDRQLSATAKVWQALEYLPLIDDAEDYLINAEIGIEAAVNSDLSLRLFIKNAYDSTPAQDREKSDTTVFGALAYKL
jgi:putative salt-induced outer membrane protein YdiY